MYPRGVPINNNMDVFSLKGRRVFGDIKEVRGHKWSKGQTEKQIGKTYIQRDREG